MDSQEIEIKGRKFAIKKSEYYTHMEVDNSFLSSAKYKKVKNTIIQPSCIVCNKGFNGRDTCYTYYAESRKKRLDRSVKKLYNVLCEKCYDSIFILATVKSNNGN